MYREIALDDTVEFPFAANDDQLSGVDGTTPLFDVRLEGDLFTAAPIFSGIPDLLTEAGYADGAYVCTIPATAANGFAWQSRYHVYITITVPTARTPVAVVGSFFITPVAAVKDTIVVGTISNAVSAPTDVNFRTTGIVDAQLNLYRGRLVGIVRGGVLVNAYTRVEIYQLTSGEGDFTVEQLPVAPTAGDIVVVF